MADTFQEFAKKLRDLRKALIQNRGQQTLLVAHESLALIRRRIQNTGLDSEGSILGVYSPQYAKQREKRGFPTDFVNLTASGAMWREIEVRITGEDMATTEVVVQGRTQRARKLLVINSNRYGDLLELSDEEEEQVFTAYIDRKVNFITDFLA